MCCSASLRLAGLYYFSLILLPDPLKKIRCSSASVHCLFVVMLLKRRQCLQQLKTHFVGYSPTNVNCQLSTNNQSEISRETCTFLHDGIHMEWIMFWISQSKFCGHSWPQISTKWVFIAGISFPFSLLPLSLCCCAGLAPPFLSSHSFLFLF